MPRLIAGAVRHYDWGDENVLPDLLGVPRTRLLRRIEALKIEEPG